MKKSVKLSLYSSVLTMVLIVLLGAMLAGLEDTIPFIIVLSILIIICGCGLWYMPMSISADDKALSINRPLKVSSIPYSEISTVELCMPTMGAISKFASGGFMGYWGWFSERDLGKYYAFYGKASDCFLVTLKNGRKYMLGCQDPGEMVKYIDKHLD